MFVTRTVRIVVIRVTLNSIRTGRMPARTGNGIAMGTLRLQMALRQAHISKPTWT